MSIRKLPFMNKKRVGIKWENLMISKIKYSRRFNLRIYSSFHPVVLRLKKFRVKLVHWLTNKTTAFRPGKMAKTPLRSRSLLGKTSSKPNKQQQARRLDFHHSPRRKRYPSKPVHCLQLLAKLEEYQNKVIQRKKPLWVFLS